MVTIEHVHNIPVFGDPLYDAVDQMEFLIAPTADFVALMADHHLGYSMPIGGVAGYIGKISPSGVGYDIGCGNKAVRLDIRADSIDITAIMDEIWDTLSFGVGLKNTAETVSHDVLDRRGRHAAAWDIVAAISKENGKGISGLHDMACGQLGTVGGGNHYVDVFSDEDGYVWIGVHFGSRGLGHKIATHFIKAAGGKDGINSSPAIMAADSELGIQYIKCMTLAGEYAYAGRDWVCDTVARIIGGTITDSVHNHHNFAWKETHGGKEMWMIRKGATPAFPGQRGFIGGSMGENAVIIEGVDSDLSKAAGYSTVHGAGRVLSRSEAKGKIHRKTGRIIKEGVVSREMMDEWMWNAGVVLRGGGQDESPHCYKRLPDVLNAHEGTIRTAHTLTPLGVAMAGADTIDPYKD